MFLSLEPFQGSRRIPAVEAVQTTARRHFQESSLPIAGTVFQQPP